MATQRTGLTEGQLGTSSASPIYTVPAEVYLVSGVISCLNTSGAVTHTIDINTSATGAAAATSNLRYSSETISPEEAREFDLPANLPPGATVYATAGTGSVVNYVMTGLLIPKVGDAV